MSYAVNEAGPARAGVRRGVRRAVLVHPHVGLGRRSAAAAPGHARARARGTRAPARSRSRASPATATTSRPNGSRRPSPPTRATSLSTESIATITELRPIVGEESVHTLDDLKKRRLNEVAFRLAKLTLERYFTADPLPSEPVPEGVSPADRRRLADADPPLALPAAPRHHEAVAGRVPDAEGPHVPAAPAAGRVRARRVGPDLPVDCRRRGAGRHAQANPPPLRRRRLHALRGLRHHPPRLETRADKCHVSHVVADTGAWEQKLAQVLEELPEVVCYVKNHNLGLTIPYMLERRRAPLLPRLRRASGRRARARMTC